MMRTMLQKPSMGCSASGGHRRLPATPARRPLAVARQGTGLRTSSTPGSNAFGSAAAKPLREAGGSSGKLLL